MHSHVQRIYTHKSTPFHVYVLYVCTYTVTIHANLSVHTCTHTHIHTHIHTLTQHNILDDILGDNPSPTDVDLVLNVLNRMGELPGGGVLEVVVEVLGDLVDGLRDMPSLVTVETGTVGYL